MIAVTASWAMEQILSLEKENKELKGQVNRMQSLLDENHNMAEEIAKLKAELDAQTKELKHYQSDAAILKDLCFASSGN